MCTRRNESLAHLAATRQSHWNKRVSRFAHVGQPHQYQKCELNQGKFVKIAGEVLERSAREPASKEPVLFLPICGRPPVFASEFTPGCASSPSSSSILTISSALFINFSRGGSPSLFSELSPRERLVLGTRLCAFSK